jgi:hypothetical protein
MPFCLHCFQGDTSLKFPLAPTTLSKRSGWDFDATEPEILRLERSVT